MEINVEMSSYSEYINDPYFMKWIFQADDLSEKYWNNFIKENPEEEKLILSIKDELSKLQLKHKELSEVDKKLIFQNILQQKQKQTAQIQLKEYMQKLLPYAAVAFLFLMVGTVFSYFYIDRKLSNETYSAFEYSFPRDQAELILADGTNLVLKRNTFIEYQNGSLLIDRKSIAKPISDKSLNNQLIIPNGCSSKIKLSDNTIVHLNAGSKLIYPTDFQKGSREVVLIGEAYFEVTKNKHKPFIVKTPYSDVKVFGTSFNVSAYPDNKQFETVLVEGSVSVRVNDSKLFKKEILLKPNQKFSFNKINEKVNVTSVDVEYDTLWKDGMLKFEDKDLAQVLKDLERHYDLKVVLANLQNEQMQISGKLNLSSNADDTFNYLSILTKLKFEKINEKNYVLK